MTKTLFSLIVNTVFLLCLVALPLISEQAVLAADNQHLSSQSMPLGPSEEIPDWQARLELARVLSYVKRYDESLIEYQKVVTEKPDLMIAQLEMAKVLFWNGNEKASLAILAKSDPNLLTEEDKLLMADLYAARKKYGEAITIYDAYLKVNPGHDPIRLKLAEVLAWAKRYDRSLAEYEIVLQHNPNHIQARRKYAFVLIWADKRSEAVVQLQKTLK